VSATVSADPQPTRAAPTYRPTGRAAECCKRAFDVAVAVTALVLTAPLFLLVAVLIKLDSPGPVFYRQVRVGRRRRRFLMWKFRKMYDDLPTQGPSLTRRYDARLTRVGRVLERTKLDELPQLFNVLAGDMSVVGPRPEVPRFVEHYQERWDVVLSVRPALVGPSQLRFRNESELYPDDCADVEAYYAEHILPEKLAIDAAYAARYSLWADVAFLFRTVLAAACGVVTRRTLLNRRGQLLNTAALTLLGLAGAVAAARVAGKPLGAQTVWQTVVLALLTKPLCLLLFKVPSALSTSVTVDDLRRCCWCAATSGLLLGAGLFLTGHPAFGLLTLAADAVIFLATLVVYKLACFNWAVRCGPRPGGRLRRSLLLASVILGPLSMAAALGLRHPPAEWAGRPGSGLALLIALAAIVRPGVVLFTPVSRGGGPMRRLLGEWAKLAVGALAGSAILAAVAAAVFQAELDPADLALDAALYLTLTAGLVAWRGRAAADPAPDAAAGGRGGEERLLVVGGGVELGAYISALAALPDHRVTVAGALAPWPGCRMRTVGGVPILGELADAPQVVQALDITRVVVVGPAVGADALERLRAGCDLADDRISHVEFPGPVLRQWRRDAAGGIPDPARPES
jgi:lipopolysaccharide/colanic/teichoic acid biosynthesis glycosyltransferase